MRTMDLHQVSNGLIVATWHLEDFFGAMAQLKAFPSLLPAALQTRQ
jgi:hypothetical protein